MSHVVEEQRWYLRESLREEGLAQNDEVVALIDDHKVPRATILSGDEATERAKAVRDFTAKLLHPSRYKCKHCKRAPTWAVESQTREQWTSFADMVHHLRTKYVTTLHASHCVSFTDYST